MCPGLGHNAVIWVFAAIAVIFDNVEEVIFVSTNKQRMTWTPCDVNLAMLQCTVCRFGHGSELFETLV